MKRSLVALAFLLIGVCVALFSQTTSDIMPSEGAKTIDDCVRQFLAGNGCDEVLAYTADGNFQEQAPTPRVIKDRYRNCKLIFLKGLTFENGTAALFAKTKMSKGPDQLHTFVLQRDQAKQWKVKGWHISHS